MALPFFIDNPNLDTRYIFYDGYNDYQVQQWLNHRGIRSAVKSSGAIYAWFFDRPHDQYIIRMREYVYIDNRTINTVRSEKLMQKYLNGELVKSIQTTYYV